MGERVDVVGTSKGKGFRAASSAITSMAVPKTHGQSDRNRAPGSRGSTTTPGRVYKGARGPGHMGDDRVTSQNLKIVLIDADRNLLGVRGAVPGAKGSIVMIKGCAQAVAWNGSEAIMEVDVVNMEGEKVRTVELPAQIFEAPINVDLMHQAYVRQMANARLGTHKTKARSEVSGGGRKPWKQKGTGRARQGSTRAVQWVGGGRVHTPKPRDYTQAMPRKMRRAALRSALSAKVAEQGIVILDELSRARTENPPDGPGPGPPGGRGQRPDPHPGEDRGLRHRRSLGK